MTRGLPRVSVVMPAFNSEGTLEAAVSSLQKQFFEDWEAIIVDDGSSDDTAVLAARLCAVDDRIQLLEQEHSGVSVARNSGIERARGDWLLFLDSDDAIHERFLVRMYKEALTTPAVDLVHCIHAYDPHCGPSGKSLPHPGLKDDPFEVVSRVCPFPIHACIVRKAAVARAGAFDPSLATCEDWDLWIRLVRQGARLRRVPETLSFYRLRPGSAISRLERVLSDGLRVLALAHNPDPRIESCPRYASGAPSDRFDQAGFALGGWVVGFGIGSGVEVMRLLRQFESLSPRGFDPQAFGRHAIFEGLNVGIAQPQSDWPAIWPRMSNTASAFLSALEDRTGIAGLCAGTLRQLTAAIVDHMTNAEPSTIGTIHRVMIDPRQPIADIEVPSEADRLTCVIGDPDDPVMRASLFAYHTVSGQRIAAAIGRRLPVDAVRHWITHPGKASFAGLVIGSFTLRSSIGAFRRSLAGFQSRQSFKSGAKQALKLFLSQLRAPVRWAQPGHAALATRNRISSIQADEYSRVFEDTRALTRPESETPKGWDRVFATVDPWDYGNEYEQTKYRQTLDLLPNGMFDRVLELGCAEGHFTQLLAPRARHLTAVDISQTALERASARCSEHTNVEFGQADIFKDDIPGTYDLIVCSELLYYAQSEDRLRMTARKLSERLQPFGHLIMAHANLIADGTNEPGFDWSEPFGAKRIGEIVDEAGSLSLVREGRALPYRIHLFQRSDRRSNGAPEVVPLTHGEMPPRVSAGLIRREFGSRPRRSGKTSLIPILAYHRVAQEGPAELARFRVRPDEFGEQLDHLQNAGFHTISSEELRLAAIQRQPMQGRPILISFDDGYRDFLDLAWPQLRIRGMTATVCIVTASVGANATWDATYADPPPLLDWDEIRTLQNEGISFAAHGCTHIPLTALAAEELIRAGARCRAVMERELGRGASVIAYPYGNYDEGVVQALRQCGFQIGLTSDDGICQLGEDAMKLPRIEVRGVDSAATLLRRLGC